MSSLAGEPLGQGTDDSVCPSQGESWVGAISDAALDAIVRIDAEGRIRYWNPAATRMFGYGAHEVTGCTVHELLVPSYLKSRAAHAMAAFASTGGGQGIGRVLELTALRRDGTSFPIEISLAPVNAGESWEAVAVIRDTTERKKAEEALSAYARELWTSRARQEADSSRMRALLAELTEAKLSAERANEAKSQFLASMSHEIRTPMNAILGICGLLLDTELSPRQRQFAEIIRTSGQILLGIVNDILDLAKIEAGRFELDDGEVRLREVVDEVAALMAVRAAEKSLDVTCIVAPDVPAAVHGDPLRLKQILNNLVGNAVKFTDAGEVAIRVTTEPQEDGGRVRFDIRDTGIGIPHDKRHLLFQPFTQLDPVATRRYGGTGLGLAITRRIVEAARGTIGASSAEPHGTVFTVRLPMRPIGEVVLAPPLRARTLVLSSRESFSEVIAAHIDPSAGPVERTESAIRALERLRSTAESPDTYDLVVLDGRDDTVAARAFARLVRVQLGDHAPKLVCVVPPSVPDCDARSEDEFDACLAMPLAHGTLARTMQALSGAGASADAAAPITAVPTTAARRMLAPRVLVVDDNETNRFVAAAVVEKLGYQVTCAPGAAEALDALSQRAYDVVLMDVQMPEVDGLAATRAIRAGAANILDPSVPVLALTAHAMGADRQRCLAAGMNDYLTKPVSAEALAAALERWAGDGRRDVPPPQSAPSSAVGSPDPSVFDREALLGRLMGDEALALKVVAGFRGDIPKRIDELERQLDAANAELIKRTAHTIKGASANVGATALRRTAAEAEAAAGQGALDRVRTLLEQLRDQMREFEVASAAI
jgi:two-component system, sensor histidine kinase and response regulator